MIILNLTQHVGTPEQGVVEPENKTLVQEFLTFSSLPTQPEMDDRASNLAAIACYHRGCSHAGDHEQWSAMIAGAPYFMSTLERALIAVGVTPVYAFSTRESVEQVIDGKTVKTSVFSHQGFVEVNNNVH